MMPPTTLIPPPRTLEKLLFGDLLTNTPAG